METATISLDRLKYLEAIEQANKEMKNIRIDPTNSFIIITETELNKLMMNTIDILMAERSKLYQELYSIKHKNNKFNLF